MLKMFMLSSALERSMKAMQYIAATARYQAPLNKKDPIMKGIGVQCCFAESINDR